MADKDNKNHNSLGSKEQDDTLLSRRAYRSAVGFTNQEKFRRYLKFTDEIPIDWVRLAQSTTRVKDIFSKINPVLKKEVQIDLKEFNDKIDNAYCEMRQNGLFHKLTNNGRNPVDVYYSWLRGYAVCEFFIKVIASIFDVPECQVKRVGKDDYTSIDVFKRTADADLEIEINDSLKYKLEVQSGFTGANDIKDSKVFKAINVKQTEQVDTYLIHFDIFNGRAALYCISKIDPSKYTWEDKFEASKTIHIPDKAFRWCFEDEPQKYTELCDNK